MYGGETDRRRVLDLHWYRGAEEEAPPAEDSGDGWVKQKKGNKKALTQETGVKVGMTLYTTPSNPLILQKCMRVEWML